MPYTPVTVTGYNSNPPPDDGSTGADNQVAWDKHKTKLGDPLKTAIDSTQTNIDTIIDTIEGRLDGLEGDLIAPTGTVMLFAQTAAPTGWTKGVTHNNKALRLVTGTASSGGTTAFTTVFASRTITQGNLPSYNLSTASLTGSVGTTITNGTSVIRLGAGGFAGVDTAGNDAAQGFDNQPTADTISLTSGTVTLGGTIPSGGSGTAMDFAVQYVDVILASKAA